MGMIGLVIFVGGLGLFALLYNSLVGKKNEVENASGAVGVYLKKRADLIPNLVASVSQYAQHEKSVLTELTKLRSQIQDTPQDSKSMVENDALFSKIMGKISVVVENYPDLKANTNFLSLQQSLNEVEEQLSAARRTYNAVVVRYNNAVEMIPTNIVAGVLGYQRKLVFQVKSEDAKNPDISALFKSAS